MEAIMSITGVVSVRVWAIRESTGRTSVDHLVGVARAVSLGVALAALVLGVMMSAAPARAEVELTGTWQGILDEGGEQQVQFRFNEDGYRLFDYTTHTGVTQTIEWTAPGRVQYVLSGGDVETVAVESLYKRPDAVSYVLHTASERARNGFVTQQFTYQQHEYRLTQEGLWVRIIRQAVSYLGDHGGSGGGPGNVDVLEGIFTRMR
jgi:hypothetical protein